MGRNLIRNYSEGGCSKAEFVPICEPLGIGTRISWDNQTKKIYWVDIPNGNVHTYDPKCGKCVKAKVTNEPLVFMFPIEGSDTRHIAGIARKFCFVDWDGKSDKVQKVEVLQEIDTEPELKDNALNGTKVDPWGRLWSGTMGPFYPEKAFFEPGRGQLYSIEKGVIKKHKSKVGICNGMAWNTETMKMYWIDTLEHKVFEYDFDDGKMCNERVAFDFKAECLDGKPDGLAMNNKGELWVCAVFAGFLVKFHPKNGKIIEKLKVPSPQVTSVCFGGEKLDLMFCTTANLNYGGKKPPGPAGSTFMIKNTGEIGTIDPRYKPC
ncbi:regucalcin-like isoform X1 [Diorhabda sublineata]|uniref:regucalcin-like isoform X1 n=1 Tax=Diorhabda sublineata TaxID=1163346 RepID=UPI0024E0A0C3|nr:regucalcin-like isoform X1 [Diorhabda sublineata]